MIRKGLPVSQTPDNTLLLCTKKDLLKVSWCSVCSTLLLRISQSDSEVMTAYDLECAIFSSPLHVVKAAALNG